MVPQIKYSITRKETTVSTNDDVVALARAGALEGTVVVAATQSGGRGRLGGRVWESPRGNAYFSFLIRPNCGVDRVSTMSPVVALAVYEALDSMGVKADLKYPNDVYVDGKKNTGILLESGVSNGDTYVAIGVGIDVFRDTGASPHFAYLSEHVDDPRPSLIDETITAVLHAFSREYGEWLRAFDISPEQETRYRDLLINPEAYEENDR